LTTQQIVEAAALIAAHSDLVIENHRPPTEDSLYEYWHFSRQRNTYWLRKLDALSAGELQIPDDTRLGARQDLLAEVFTTEMLTRVWGAVLTLAAQRQSGRVHCSERSARTLGSSQSGAPLT
jgi:hypothetical protein